MTEFEKARAVAALQESLDIQLQRLEQERAAVKAREVVVFALQQALSVHTPPPEDLLFAEGDFPAAEPLTPVQDEYDQAFASSAPEPKREPGRTFENPDRRDDGGFGLSGGAPR